MLVGRRRKKQEKPRLLATFPLTKTPHLLQTKKKLMTVITLAIASYSPELGTALLFQVNTLPQLA